jgi:pimeloyl-ACP methyl ester carboxylesterase
MHFVRTGRGAPPLVFVHGFACSHEDWRAQLELFASSHEVVACDLRGHGTTPGRPHECSIEHYGGDVAALLANLELPASILVGHSMGCRVVLEAARLDPQRVAGLVLVDGSRIGSGDPAEAEAAARAAIESAGYAAFARKFFSDMFLAPSEEAERIIARAMRLPAEIGAALLPRMVRWDAENMDRTLAAVRAPLMAIQSTYVNAERKRVPLQKGETTPWLELLRAKAPGARIEVVPGVGHFSQLEAAGTVNRLIASFSSSSIPAR